MKLRIQAQHLQPGDTCSGGIIKSIIINSTHWPSSKVFITIQNGHGYIRSAYWGKYTMINVERADET